MLFTSTRRCFHKNTHGGEDVYFGYSHFHKPASKLAVITVFFPLRLLQLPTLTGWRIIPYPCQQRHRMFKLYHLKSLLTAHRATQPADTPHGCDRFSIQRCRYKTLNSSSLRSVTTNDDAPVTVTSRNSITDELIPVLSGKMLLPGNPREQPTSSGCMYWGLPRSALLRLSFEVWRSQLCRFELSWSSAGAEATWAIWRLLVQPRVLSRLCVKVSLSKIRKKKTKFPKLHLHRIHVDAPEWIN